MFVLIWMHFSLWFQFCIYFVKLLTCRLHSPAVWKALTITSWLYRTSVISTSSNEEITTKKVLSQNEYFTNSENITFRRTSPSPNFTICEIPALFKSNNLRKKSVKYNDSYDDTKTIRRLQKKLMIEGALWKRSHNDCHDTTNVTGTLCACRQCRTCPRNKGKLITLRVFNCVY